MHGVLRLNVELGDTVHILFFPFRTSMFLASTCKRTILEMSTYSSHLLRSQTEKSHWMSAKERNMGGEEAIAVSSTTLQWPISGERVANM